MANWKFQKWTAAATSRIVFPPDRWAVEQELRGHLQDRYEDGLMKGMTAEDAENHALEAMGPAEEIAAELGMIHRPFWGRVHLISRRAAMAMVCLTILVFCAWLLKSLYFRPFTQPEYHRYDPFEDVSAFDDGGSYRRLSSGQPLSVDVSDGYLFILRQYALWDEHSTDTQGKPQEEKVMYLEMQVVSLVPWAFQTDISRWFGARDDLGNTYSPAYDRDDGNYLTSSVYHTGPGIYTHILRFSRFLSQDATQLELFCNRGGRYISLWVDFVEEAEK